MRRVICCVGFILILKLNTSYAQPLQFAFRISFTNKTGSADITNPLSFLSQKALDRRSKYAIAVDTTDLPVSPDYLDSVRSNTNGIIHTTSRWLNNCVVLVEDSSIMQTLRTKPFVTNVEWVGYFPSGLHNKPALGSNDQKFSEEKLVTSNGSKFKTTGSPAYYGATWDQTRLVNGDCLHDKGWNGEGILIAVFDNGFSYVNSGPVFDSLYNSGRIVDTFNFSRDTNSVYGSGSHGTQVLSILAGYLPNYYVGAAPKANYALYITEDAGFEQPIELDNLVAGFERADSIGTDLMSMSVGYNTFFSPFQNITSAEMDGKTIGTTKAANMAMDKGILMVITAGNEGTNGLLVPGDADSVLTIGNVNINRTPAGNSGYGPNASGTIKPNVCGMGNPGAVMTWNMNVSSVSGTSMSTPSVAGFAACLLQGFPTMKPSQIRDAIQRTGHSYNNPTAQLGYGVPDFCAASILLGVNDDGFTENNFASVYPNPFFTDFNVQVNSLKNEPTSIAVYDVAGKLLLKETHLLKKGDNKITMNTSYLNTGIYFLKVNNTASSETIKIIKY